MLDEQAFSEQRREVQGKGKGIKIVRYYRKRMNSLLQTWGKAL